MMNVQDESFLLLADGVAVVHAAYVAFVAIGFALIVAGLAMHWDWVRAFWFRVAHLGAIASYTLSHWWEAHVR
jgi:hypothetical protein